MAATREGLQSALQDIGELMTSIDDKAVEIDEQSRPGQTPGRNIRADVGESCPHQVGCVLAVEDRKTLAVTELIGVPSENAMTYGVERPTGDPGCGSLHELANAAHHLPGCLVGKGQQKDLTRRHAILDQATGAIHQSTGLSGACARERQHRPAGMHHHLELLRIELCFVANSVATDAAGFPNPVRHGRQSVPKTERSKARVVSLP